MIKKHYRKWLWLLSIILLLTNWQGFKNFTGLNDWYYRYSNISGNVTVMENPIKGRLFKKPIAGKLPVCKLFRNGKKIEQKDTVLCRLFAINPLKFWRWGEYIFDWRYRLPYADWEAIKKRRGFDYLKISKDCMEF